MMRGKIGLAVGGVAVVVVVLAMLWQQGILWSGPKALIKQVEDTKTLVVGLRATFEKGELQERRQGGRDGEGGRPDSRMDIVMLSLDRFERQINKEPQAAWHKPALGKVQEARALMLEVGPKFEQAVSRQDKSAAKGFVDYMIRLDKHLEELLAILQGKARSEAA